MKHKLTRNAANPLREISELQVFADFSDQIDTPIRVSSDVRIGPAVEELSGRDFRYGPRKAALLFKVAGCYPEKGLRFNDATQESIEISETERQHTTNEKSAHFEANGDASVGLTLSQASASASGGFGARTLRVTELERTKTTKKLGRFVKARPNLRWDFESRNYDDPDCFLDDSYLTGQDLFSLSMEDGANGVSIEGYLFCRKKDFGIAAVQRKLGDGFFGAANREAIMALVLQKALKEAEVTCGLLGEEFLVLSKCSLGEAD